LALSYWFDKPWFLSEEKLAAVLIIPSSWGSQLGSHLHQHRTAIKLFSGAVAGDQTRRSSHINYTFPRQLGTSCFLAPLPRKKKTSARGVSHAHPLLCFCFALLYFCLHRFIKNTKKLVSFIVFFIMSSLVATTMLPEEMIFTFKQKSE
jgi:hypothetical protein